jgi:hypothetical protein
MASDESSGRPSGERRAPLRAALLDAITARLGQIGESGDPAPALEPEALSQAAQLFELIREDQADLQSRLLLGVLHWCRYQALPAGEDQEDLRTAVRMFIPCFTAGVHAELLPRPLLPVLADQASSSALRLLGEALSSREPRLIATAVGLHRRLVAATSASHPQRACRLSNLGIALRAQFEATGDPRELDEAVQFMRDALAAASGDRDERAIYTSNLGVTLWTRFHQTGMPADLDEGIQLMRLGVADTPVDHPNRIARLTKLGKALGVRAELADDRAAREEADRILGEARATGPVNFPSWVAYEATPGRMAADPAAKQASAAPDPEKAVHAIRETLAAAPPDDPARPERLLALGHALIKRFERSGRATDLDEAIQVIGEATAAAPADHQAMYASVLGMSLRERFEHTGRRQDLDDAIRVGGEALDATPVGHPTGPPARQSCARPFGCDSNDSAP